jgi:hypothetical protein
MLNQRTLDLDEVLPPLPPLTPAQTAHAEALLLGRQPPPYRIFQDGMAVWVYAMTFGKGRLAYGHKDDRIGYEKAWCYHTITGAFAAADTWDGHGDPPGWFRNLQTGQYSEEPA